VGQSPDSQIPASPGLPTPQRSGTFGGRSPVTVAGPRRTLTDFLSHAPYIDPNPQVSDRQRQGLPGIGASALRIACADGAGETAQPLVLAGVKLCGPFVICAHHLEELLSTPRFGALVGLALGAIWAVAGFDRAALAGLLSAVGYVIVLVLQHRVDLTRFLGHDHDGQAATSGPATIQSTQRTRTKLQ
jgi:hypothetical protein